MKVQVRLTRYQTASGRRRGLGGRSVADHGPSIASHAAHGTALPLERRRAREAGPPQDNALYACRCGLVFQAAVSTSVDCPRCGDAQAW
ncbi:MAG: hypothetical protein E6G05_07100 [Actinobacteria bacterium]|jgi:hypothetical protein|nr:MAG: hypothetical protein E6G05_07100 [Actinomycetota bacterium]